MWLHTVFIEDNFSCCETVEIVYAGIRYDFTSAFIVVSHVDALLYSGTKIEISLCHKTRDQGESVHGLKALGVKVLNSQLTFLACSIFATSLRVCMNNYHPHIMQIKFFMFSFHLKTHL